MSYLANVELQNGILVVNNPTTGTPVSTTTSVPIGPVSTGIGVSDLKYTRSLRSQSYDIQWTYALLDFNFKVGDHIQINSPSTNDYNVGEIQQFLPNIPVNSNSYGPFDTSIGPSSGDPTSGIVPGDNGGTALSIGTGLTFQTGDWIILTSASAGALWSTVGYSIAQVISYNVSTDLPACYLRYYIIYGFPQDVGFSNYSDVYITFVQPGYLQWKVVYSTIGDFSG